MNLLLILSALLGALTGAIGVRVPEVRLHQAATTVRVAAQAAPVRATPVRPAVTLPRLSVLALRPGNADFALTDAVPAYAMRRRE